MELIEKIFGVGSDLTVYQMSARAVAVFFVALILLRVAGGRTFGRKSAFDEVIVIILGAVIGRGIVGASPFIPVIAASAAIVILHRLLGWIAIGNHTVGRLIKGEKLLLYSNGASNARNMQRAMISTRDLMESVRIMTNQDTLEDIDEIYIERTGEISVIKKSKKDNHNS